MGILTYIKIGSAIVLITIGSYFVLNYKYLQSENRELKTQIVAYERIKEIYEHDVEIDKEIIREKERVDKLAPTELDAEYNKLRNKARPGKDNNS